MKDLLIVKRIFTCYKDIIKRIFTYISFTAFKIGKDITRGKAGFIEN